MRSMLLSIFVISICSSTKADFDGTVDKIVGTINQAAENDKNIEVRSSKYFNSAMDQLNLEFINPYNASDKSIFLEHELGEKLRKDLSTCKAAGTAIGDLKERANYFANQISASKPDDSTICPVFIPLIQREHELVMGLLLNRLRLHVLKAKMFPWELEDRADLARSLKKIAENRFGSFEQKMMSCKQNVETIGNSCIQTGLLTAGSDEVITGLRLKKENNVIIPQIQVSKVTVFGLIDKNKQKWKGPTSSKSKKNPCLPINTLVAVKPARLPQGQGYVLTQLRVVAPNKEKLEITGKKFDLSSGKLGKLQKSTIEEYQVRDLKDVVAIDTEPVYVSTTIAGAGLRYDMKTKLIYPSLLAKNMALELFA